jgi:hypothetical protein
LINKIRFSVFFVTVSTNKIPERSKGKMRKDLSGKTLGIIHAAVFTSQTVQKYIDEIIPEVSVMHLGDDTIQRDNLAAGVGVVPKSNYAKFITYARFLEEAGAEQGS